MLKIKKHLKQSDGTIIEVEGTEAEVEAYEKKQTKKNETVQRKKEILHGKAAKLAAKVVAKPEVLEELKKYITEEVAKLQAIREIHHWHFDNGWWWRPWYYNGTFSYLYSQTTPLSEYTGTTNDFYSVYSGDSLSQQIGLNKSDIIRASGIENSTSYSSPHATYTSSVGTLIKENSEGSLNNLNLNSISNSSNFCSSVN